MQSMSVNVKDGVWDVDLFKQYLPSGVVNEILNHHYANDEIRPEDEHHKVCSITALCLLYQSTNEFEIHILRDCNVTSMVWGKLKKFQRDMPNRKWNEACWTFPKEGWTNVMWMVLSNKEAIWWPVVVCLGMKVEDDYANLGTIWFNSVTNDILLLTCMPLFLMGFNNYAIKSGKSLSHMGCVKEIK
ncbi:hypothetical protein VNO78_14080 [Psophocarpus tetragonolobus]|uniref:Uncharacterized protein n=1 Tax=Psophocarpus tetragonolobus TaxID=3891 RepID=A0AAN9SR19_PSOTE